MMSNFKIVHEIDGRLRVRFGQYAFTNEQATILKSDFLKLEYVRYVEAHYKNGSLLLVFDENYKNEVFGYLKSYDLSTLQNREIPENCSQNLQVLDQSFKHELIKIFAKRYAVKLFLPNVVGKGIAIYKALAYFKAGIASLGNKRIDVPVLDATSIGISLLRKEFNTASNIMLMLKISELLEDYTRQKVTLQLGDSLMNKFDKVWIYKDGQEQEIAMSDLKQGQTVIVQTGSMVPIDGEIIDGEAMVNESSFTGEPLSKRVTLNDTVYAGTLIEEGKIFVKVRNLQDESRIAKIIDMIGNSYNKERKQLENSVKLLTKKQGRNLSNIKSLQKEASKVSKRLGWVGYGLTFLTLALGFASSYRTGGSIDGSIIEFVIETFIALVEYGAGKLFEWVARFIPYIGFLLGLIAGWLVSYLLGKFFNNKRVKRIKAKFSSLVKNARVSLLNWIKYAAKSLTA